jgi:hypothetical protein
MILPQINAGNKNRLLAAWIRMGLDVTAAISILRHYGPASEDYGGNYLQAQTEHQERIDALHNVKAEINFIIEHIRKEK